MNVTRSQMIKNLSEKTGYCQKDIQQLLSAYDEAVMEAFARVEDDEDVSVQLVQGAKLSVHVVPARERIHPKTKEPISVDATVKPSVKFSKGFRATIQEQYEAKNG